MCDNNTLGGSRVSHTRAPRVDSNSPAAKQTTTISSERYVSGPWGWALTTTTTTEREERRKGVGEEEEKVHTKTEREERRKEVGGGEEEEEERVKVCDRETEEEEERRKGVGGGGEERVSVCNRENEGEVERRRKEVRGEERVSVCNRENEGEVERRRKEVRGEERVRVCNRENEGEVERRRKEVGEEVKVYGRQTEEERRKEAREKGKARVCDTETEREERRKEVEEGVEVCRAKPSGDLNALPDQKPTVAATTGLSPGRASTGHTAHNSTAPYFPLPPSSPPQPSPHLNTPTTTTTHSMSSAPFCYTTTVGDTHDTTTSLAPTPPQRFPAPPLQEKRKVPESLNLEFHSSSTLQHHGDRSETTIKHDIVIDISEHTDSTELLTSTHQRNGVSINHDECAEVSSDKDQSSRSDTSKDSKRFLRVPQIYRGGSSAPNSSPSIPNSVLSSSCQFRRLESRRGSSVTFFLPTYVSSGESSSQASSRHEFEEGASFQERFYNLHSRRMSAPELPPIGDRERGLRPGSRSTNRSSYSQLTPSVVSTSKQQQQAPPRLLSGPPSIPRYDSEYSFKGLTTRSQGPTQSSGSVSSYRSGGPGGREGVGGVGENGGGGGDLRSVAGRGGGGGERCITPVHPQRSSSRAQSWSTTDNGSLLKLETLFEQKHAGHGHSSSINNLAVPGSSSDHAKRGGNSMDTHLPPRSCSVNGLRPSETLQLARLRARERKGPYVHSDCGLQEMETVGTIEQFSCLKPNGMRRAVSENKLADKRNVRNNNARNNTSQHISVSKTDKLTRAKKSSARPPGNSNVSATNNGTSRRVVGYQRGVHSFKERHKSRLNSNQDSAGNPDEDLEDSEEEEERRERIREWLMGLDCADAPPEPVIEYADDPPQTDTAVHIVYQDD